MSPSPEDPPVVSRRVSPASRNQDSEFSAEERQLLLHLAHEAVLSILEHRQISLTPPSPHLAEARGAFTTLYFRKELHGCVGYMLPVTSLWQTVAETARAAAFGDTRFSPVTIAEASELEVSLSILSPLQPIQPEEVEIGRHGLVVSQGHHRGLLLPQVPIEHSWDRIKFLEQTCRKAGLPADSWQKDARIEGFTAEIFSD